MRTKVRCENTACGFTQYVEPSDAQGERARNDCPQCGAPCYVPDGTLDAYARLRDFYIEEVAE